MKNITISGLSIALAMSLTACQSTSEPAQIASETNQAQQQSTNTLQIFEKAKSDYTQWLRKMEESQSFRLYSSDLVDDLFDAWEEAVDVYADFDADPEKATESYSLFSSGTYAEVFDKRLGEVAALHAELLTLKQTADDLLAEAITEMAYLDAIGAEEVFSSRYKRIAKEYRSLFVYVADNDLDDAQLKQVRFLKNAKSLEVAVVLKRNIEPLQKELALLRKEGFRSIAPISYAKANAALDQAAATVSAEPRAEDVIEEAVFLVNFELDHLKHMGLEVKRFKSVNDGKFEPLILALENQIHRISQALDQQDLRNKPIKQQTDLLAGQAETLVKSLKNKPDVDPQLMELMAKLEEVNSDLSNTEQQVDVLSAQVVTLEAKKASDESLIDDLRMVIDTIKPDEAKVKPAENSTSVSDSEAVAAEDPKV
ncbi:hypothetical protein LRP50_08180 [Enterovibrio sp. ZSDZ42]|uniref:ATPase n=1 Tax=Enterovibrio gelatinilyticus TaxID=2899819 RepID=A0ABT5QYN8_9GAMM|nr:hypothetical protein [Enterovibrio sp. ZSDZ42]MDD1793104.1 hypothetical protein [Enterovibrio sp. ZSDZ42]